MNQNQPKMKIFGNKWFIHLIRVNDYKLMNSLHDIVTFDLEKR